MHVHVHACVCMRRRVSVCDRPEFMSCFYHAEMDPDPHTPPVSLQLHEAECGVCTVSLPLHNLKKAESNMLAFSGH